MPTSRFPLSHPSCTAALEPEKKAGSAPRLGQGARSSAERAVAGSFAGLLIIQEPVYDKRGSLPSHDKAHGSTEPHYPKKNRALWATRAQPSAHTQADIVRLFAQPRSAPRGFPAKQTFRSHGVGCKHLLLQHGFGRGPGETWVRGPLCWPFTGRQAGILGCQSRCCAVKIPGLALLPPL